jgi:hypothetical protein
MGIVPAVAEAEVEGSLTRAVCHLTIHSALPSEESGGGRQEEWNNTGLSRVGGATGPIWSPRIPLCMGRNSSERLNGALFSFAAERAD